MKDVNGLSEHKRDTELRKTLLQEDTSYLGRHAYGSSERGCVFSL